MLIKERILQIAENKGIAKPLLCKNIGSTYGNFTGVNKNRPINSDFIANLLSIYPDVSAEWLLTGRGSMLKTKSTDDTHVPDNAHPCHSDSEVTENNRHTQDIIKKKSDDNVALLGLPANGNAGRLIPLVSQSAAAGFGNADFAISEADVKDYYVIPKFKYCKVDFMIEISGSSMYPKYNSGDVVACTIIRDGSFIQWNKCHIIATRDQGILCKRLRPSDKDGCIMAVSDNKDYPPFDIPKSEITGIALVCGVIRLE